MASKPKNRVRNAALWVTSPLFVLAGVALMQTITRAHAPDGLFFINLLSVIIGSAGVVLLVLGPIVGVMILRSK